MNYGYARVSTIGQAKNGNSLPEQERLLKSAGCTIIYHDHYTGTKMDRPEFSKLLSVLRPGDRLVVTKLDRFARTAAAGITMIRDLLDKQISVHILNMGLIDNTPTGKLMITVLLAFAEFERDMIVERTQQGKAQARLTNPNYRDGRPRLYPAPADQTSSSSSELLSEIISKKQKGLITVQQACDVLHISRSTWYNLIRQQQTITQS